MPIKFRKYITTIFFFLILAGTSKAETWNEPWQKEIIKNSDYFVLAKVLKNNKGKGVTIKIIKSFGNQKIDGNLLINGFSQLEMMSSSGQGLPLNFKKNQKIYFFLKKKEDGNYAIPTPTSGFAEVGKNNKVYATYRHSYHRALVPIKIYEKTYTEIWNYYKTGKFDLKKVSSFIEDLIAKEPAGFEDNEIKTFFLQHVAMETAFLLDIEIDINKIKKFVYQNNFHSNISALQLMGNSRSEVSKEFLYNYVMNDSNESFQKIIAIWSLSKIGDKIYISKLIANIEKLSDENAEFGGNIMDPRVGTYLPSPKSAVENLEKSK